MSDDNGPRWVHAVGWALPGFVVLELAVALVLIVLNAGHEGPGVLTEEAILAVAVVIYAGTGRIIASRVPGNAVGWLLGLIGLSVATSMFTEQYALYGLVTARGSGPAARWIGILAGGAARTAPRRQR